MEDRAQQLQKFKEDWVAAELSGDTSFMENNLTDDFVGIGPRGFMLSKEDWLERHGSGKLRYESFRLDETQERLYKVAAIITARQIAKGKYEEYELEGQFRITLLLVEQKERWLLAGIQHSPIIGPPSR